MKVYFKIFFKRVFDVCATAQWYYGNGDGMTTEELTEDHQIDQYPYEEEPQYDQEQYWDYQEGDYAILDFSASKNWDSKEGKAKGKCLA